MKTYSAATAIRRERQRQDDLARLQRLNPHLEPVDNKPHVTVLPAPPTSFSEEGRGDRRQRRVAERSRNRRAANSVRRSLREA